MVLKSPDDIVYLLCCTSVPLLMMLMSGVATIVARAASCHLLHLQKMQLSDIITADWYIDVSCLVFDSSIGHVLCEFLATMKCIKVVDGDFLHTSLEHFDLLHFFMLYSQLKYFVLIHLNGESHRSLRLRGKRLFVVSLDEKCIRQVPSSLFLVV
jgi:hypothetical protein